MTVPRLVHGYGPHGYEILARSRELEPWIESLFLDVADRWPFSEVRESLVLVRKELPARGSLAVLVRSRLHQGKPVHRQTGMALFRLDDLARAWCGLLPLVECLPPYVPDEAILPDVVIRPTDLKAPRWEAVSLGKDWFSDAWSRLAAGEQVRLPEVEERQEPGILDLLACALPPQTAARLNMAVGLQRGGLLSVGPAVEGRAEDPGHPRKSPGLGPPVHQAPLAWVRRIRAQGSPDASVADLGLAIRAAIVELARLERIEPQDVDAPLLEASTRRELAIDWLVTDPPVTPKDLLGWFSEMLESDARVTTLHEALRIRLTDMAPQAVTGAVERLAWVVRRLEGQTSFARRVPALVGTLLFEGDFGGPNGPGRALRVSSKVASPRYQGPPSATTVGIEARYWSLVGRWLVQELRRGVTEVRTALSREWNRVEPSNASARLPLQAPGSARSHEGLHGAALEAQGRGTDAAGQTAETEGRSPEVRPLDELVRTYVQVSRQRGHMEPELLDAAGGFVDAGNTRSLVDGESKVEGT